MPIFFDDVLGAEVEFPDGMDPVKQQNALARLRQSKMQQPGGANLGFMGQLLSGISSQQSQPQMPDQTYATISPAAGYAMMPDTFRAVLNTRQEALNAQRAQALEAQQKREDRQQQSQIELARSQMEQKRMLQQEKYYGDSLKLQKLRYQNEANSQALRDRIAQDEQKIRQQEAAAKREQGQVSDGQQFNWDPATKQWTAKPIPGYQKPPDGTENLGRIIPVGDQQYVQTGPSSISPVYDPEREKPPAKTVTMADGQVYTEVDNGIWQNNATRETRDADTLFVPLEERKRRYQAKYAEVYMRETGEEPTPEILEKAWTRFITPSAGAAPEEATQETTPEESSGGFATGLRDKIGKLKKMAEMGISSLYDVEGQMLNRGATKSGGVFTMPDGKKFIVRDGVVTEVY